jgi:hypothetical protein
MEAKIVGSTKIEAGPIDLDHNIVSELIATESNPGSRISQAFFRPVANSHSTKESAKKISLAPHLALPGNVLSSIYYSRSGILIYTH